MGSFVLVWTLAWTFNEFPFLLFEFENLFLVRYFVIFRLTPKNVTQIGRKNESGYRDGIWFFSVLLTKVKLFILLLVLNLKDTTINDWEGIGGEGTFISGNKGRRRGVGGWREAWYQKGDEHWSVNHANPAVLHQNTKAPTFTLMSVTNQATQCHWPFYPVIEFGKKIAVLDR